MGSANERMRHIETLGLIEWAHSLTQNDRSNQDRSIMQLDHLYPLCSSMILIDLSHTWKLPYMEKYLL